MHPGRKRILIVEDDAVLREFLAEMLAAHGYEIRLAGTLNEAAAALEESSFALVLLDIMLGENTRGGLEILKYIRRRFGNALPVIMQTALADDAVCVECLKSGADDYVVKPVRIGPLIARTEAVLRRAAHPDSPTEIIPLGKSARLNCSRREIEFKSGECVRLTFKEIQLLRLLWMRRGEFVSQEEMLVHAWGHNPVLADIHRVKTMLYRLRKKLASVAEFENAYGGCYRLRLLS